MAKYDNPIMSELAPRMGNAVTRTIGRVILRMIGWETIGKLPNEKQVVIIGAPHTSNWDLILAIGFFLESGLKCSWMMKKEAFFWPLGPLWKTMGGLPIDRKANTDITAQIANWFDTTETAWLGIAPEGTRSKVERYKTGYLRMAYAANVPVFIIGVDARKKQLVMDKTFPLTGDLKTDNAAIQAYYSANFEGMRPEKG